MNNCRLTSPNLLLFIKHLQNCFKIKEFHFCNNYLNDEPTEVIVLTILQWNSLEVFEFEQNQFKQKSKLLFKFLLHQLKFSDVSLNLTSNLDHLNSFISLLGYIEEVPTKKSNYIQSISKIRKLDLNCLNLSIQLELTVTSSKGFKIFNQLVFMDISGILINEITVEALVETFEKNLQLEWLSMNKCQITSAVINVFSDHLKQLKYLKIFEISDNFINDEGAEALVIAILHWNSLECIKIDKNRFSTHGMFLLNMLTTIMKSEFIVNFSNNYHIIKSLIKVLDHANNNTGERVANFLNALSEINELALPVQKSLEMTLNASNTLKRIRKMTLIDVSGITITEQVANDLCDIFDNNQYTLQHVSMNNCQLTSKTTTTIIKYLQKCLQIREIHLCDNCIDDKAIEEIAVAILFWELLEVIEVNNTKLSDQSKFLLRLLTNNFQSTSLSINFSYQYFAIKSFMAILNYAASKFDNGKKSVKFIEYVSVLLLCCSQQFQLPFQASYFFQYFVSLKELDISGMVINQQTANVLSKAFGNDLRSLECLYMNNCGLTTEMFKIFVMQLKNANIKELQWCRNLIGNEVIEQVAIAILDWNSLKKLNTARNVIVLNVCYC